MHPFWFASTACGKSWASLSETECGTEICSQLNPIKTINQRLQQRYLCYFGHVVHTKDTRYPKLSLYGYVHGRRHGQPKKCWLDRVKEDCADMGVNISEATRCAQNCQLWTESIGELLLHT